MASTTTFDLSGQKLKLETAEDVKKHIEPLTQSTSYTAILFNGNTIGVEAAQHFAQVIATQKNLEYVNFSDIFTGRLTAEIPQAMDAFVTAFLELPKLQTIDLSDNAFGLQVIAPLLKFLKAHVPLQHLILNNNGMGPIAGAQLGEALTELAGKKEEARKAGKTVPDLESIVCGRNRLETGSMEAWAKAYTSLGKVKSVKMTQNGIRQEGINILLRQGLANCKGLEVIDLEDNTFTVTGSRALAAVVSEWPEIREIGVNDCLVSTSGFKSVAKALAKGKNKKLETLKATFGEIGKAGLDEFIKTAQGSGLPELRRVELNGNQFPEDDENVEQLRSVLGDRRKEKGAEDDDDDEKWGLDELDDMEEVSDEEEEEDDDEGEDEEEQATDKKQADETAQEKKETAPAATPAAATSQGEGDVDDLAASLEKKLEI